MKVDSLHFTRATKLGKNDSSHLSTEEAKTSSDILKAFLQDLFRSERVAANPLAALSAGVVVFKSFFFFLSFFLFRALLLSLLLTIETGFGGK